MKRLFEISIGAIISLLLVTGCMHTTVKPEQPKSGQAAEKKTIFPATVTPEHQKNESLGVIGGTGAQKSTGLPETTVRSENKEEQLIKEIVKQFRSDYGKTDDKLGFLLAHIDSLHDEILIEVARRLVEFDDPRSIAALEKLEKHQQRKEISGSVAQIAGEGLEYFAAAPDLKKLKPGMPPVELEAIVKKYATNNNTAHKVIYSFMRKEYEANPVTYVPLFVEYYADASLARELAKKYPDLGDKGLAKCLRSTEVSVVSSCVGLIAGLKKFEYLDQIQAVSFRKKGNFDYTERNWSQIKSRAFNAYWFMGELSIKQLEQVLYVGTANEKRSAVNYLGNIKSKASLQVLKEYRKSNTNDKVFGQDLLKQLDSVILDGERALK